MPEKGNGKSEKRTKWQDTRSNEFSALVCYARAAFFMLRKDVRMPKVAKSTCITYSLCQRCAIVSSPQAAGFLLEQQLELLLPLPSCQITV